LAPRIGRAFDGRLAAGFRTRDGFRVVAAAQKQLSRYVPLGM